jgi:hypothetical protein
VIWDEFENPSNVCTKPKITQEERLYTRHSVVSVSACTVQIVVQGYSVFRYSVFRYSVFRYSVFRYSVFRYSV